MLLKSPLEICRHAHRVPALMQLYIDRLQEKVLAEPMWFVLVPRLYGLPHLWMHASMAMSSAQDCCSSAFLVCLGVTNQQTIIYSFVELRPLKSHDPNHMDGPLAYGLWPRHSGDETNVFATAFFSNNCHIFPHDAASGVIDETRIAIGAIMEPSEHERHKRCLKTGSRFVFMFDHTVLHVRAICFDAVRENSEVFSVLFSGYDPRESENLRDVIVQCDQVYHECELDLMLDWAQNPAAVDCLRRELAPLSLHSLIRIGQLCALQFRLCHWPSHLLQQAICAHPDLFTARGDLRIIGPHLRIALPLVSLFMHTLGSSPLGIPTTLVPAIVALPTLPPPPPDPQTPVLVASLAPETNTLLTRLYVLWESIWATERNLVRLSTRQLLKQLEPTRNRFERYTSEARRIEQLLHKDSTNLPSIMIHRQRINFLHDCIEQIEKEVRDAHEQRYPRSHQVSERAARITRTSLSLLLDVCYFSGFDEDEPRDGEQSVLVCSPQLKLAKLRAELAQIENKV